MSQGFDPWTFSPRTITTGNPGALRTVRGFDALLSAYILDMKGKGDDDRYSEEETARRADEVIKRMLNTPPQPRTTKPAPKAKERPASKGRVHKGKARR